MKTAWRQLVRRVVVVVIMAYAEKQRTFDDNAEEERLRFHLKLFESSMAETEGSRSSDKHGNVIPLHSK
jgi:hypothetical protein